MVLRRAFKSAIATDRRDRFKVVEHAPYAAYGMQTELIFAFEGKMENALTMRGHYVAGSRLSVNQLAYREGLVVVTLTLDATCGVDGGRLLPEQPLTKTWVCLPVWLNAYSDDP